MTRLMLPGDNIALVTTRMTKGEDFGHVMVTQYMAEVICLSARTSNNGFVFPLYADASEDHKPLLKSQAAHREANLRPDFCKALEERLSLTYREEGRGDSARSFGPEDVLSYVLAILHSPGYRGRYREYLSRDFPRIPLPGGAELFGSVCRLGRELRELHLLKCSSLEKPITTYVGPAEPEVEKVIYANNTVWLDKKQTRGFIGVPDAVWNFHVGGYQVCDKWLKYRKGRTLSGEDLTHYQRIIVALNETIRLMKEIEETIEKHGGWPGAFINDGKRDALAAQTYPAVL